MPRSYKRKPSRFSRNRPTKKRTSKTVHTATRRSNYRRVSRGPLNQYVSADPFPPSKFSKLTYTESFTFTSGAGGILGSEQRMSLNSIFDPNMTGTGHQPYGHDQMALLYKNYKVYAVSFKLVFNNPSADGMYVGVRVCNPNDTQSITGLTGPVLQEAPMSTTRMINNTGKQVIVISQYFPMSTLLGLTPLQFKAATASPFSALFGNSPGNQPTLHFAAGSTAGATGDSIHCQCSVTYYTQAYERIVLGQS